MPNIGRGQQMKILYYDCFSGISGDMNLGALIDVGVPENYLVSELKKLNISGYEIEINKDMRKGIFGTKVNVLLKEGGQQQHIDHEHEHEHNNDHSHEHAHDHHHVNESHMHHHRGLKEIEEIIHQSALSEKVKKMSMDIFMQVARAEAKVHNKPIYEVHFHEVGAIDSIIDTVGAAIAIDYLKVDKIICSSIELGGGFVKCAHGMIPVPAPAVVEILQDVPVKSGKVQFETTTPTGAAILKALADEYSDNKNFSMKKVGYGIGQRDTDIPNVLRVFLAETKENIKLDVETAYVLECNIDDMNPEFYDYIIDGLFEKGAADVFLTPIIMKKGRPAVKLSVLVKNETCEAIEEFIFCETSTLGFRKYQVEKNMLKRDFHKLDTKFGSVTIKNGYYNGKKVKSKPEYSDCKELALKNGVGLKEIYDEINKL
jgi:uncharacterized protein (TIGR00299 family) protein